MMQYLPWAPTRSLCLVLLPVLLLSTACSKKMSFQTSSVTPAAEGAVKVKKDNNGNYSISIHVTHLATPDKLTPPKKNYVVWMVTKTDKAKHIGLLNTSKDFLSNKLTASLKTVSSFKPTRIFITAEDYATVVSPGALVVLTTK